MRKFLMSVALGLAFLCGTNSTRASEAAPEKPAAVAAMDGAEAAYGHWQCFGPYTQAGANTRVQRWTAAGYRCYSWRYLSGWYVWCKLRN